MVHKHNPRAAEAAEEEVCQFARRQERHELREDETCQQAGAEGCERWWRNGREARVAAANVAARVGGRWLLLWAPCCSSGQTPHARCLTLLDTQLETRLVTQLDVRRVMQIVTRHAMLLDTLLDTQRVTWIVTRIDTA